MACWLCYPTKFNASHRIVRKGGKNEEEDESCQAARQQRRGGEDIAGGVDGVESGEKGANPNGTPAVPIDHHHCSMSHDHTSTPTLDAVGGSPFSLLPSPCAVRWPQAWRWPQLHPLAPPTLSTEQMQHLTASRSLAHSGRRPTREGPCLCVFATPSAVRARYLVGHDAADVRSTLGHS